jgi:excinuclease UvrABC nuclease subunit
MFEPLLSDRIAFSDVNWQEVPESTGVYVIYDKEESIYVGMAGREKGAGNLRKRLRDHSSGQTVNMFAQYLFLARVQFESDERITHPKVAKVACRKYIVDRCSFRYIVAESGKQAREIEDNLKLRLKPALNA